MITETIVNAAANSALVVSALGLLIHIFGDPDNSIWDNKIKAYLAKAGLSITICGAVTNVITLSTPPVSEVVLNCGISVTFFWLSWWQYELFKEAQKKHNSRRIVKPARKRTKRNAKNKVRVRSVWKDMEP